MAFPAILTPALEILAVSAGSERGILTAVGVIGTAILVAVVIVLANLRGTYLGTDTFGSAGVVFGTLLLP